LLAASNPTLSANSTLGDRRFNGVCAPSAPRHLAL
jgi:hypothetical protein